MDLVAVNKDRELQRNPWGRMTLSRINPAAPVQYGDEYRVDISHPVTGKRSMLGFTNPGKPPWDLVCGNRPYEFEHAMKAYARSKAETQRNLTGIREDHRKDFRAELRKFIHSRVDGRHDLAQYLRSMA